jgi:CRP-like cAMP-binding protein
MSEVAEKLVGGIPLFAGIEPAELAGFLRIFQPVTFDAGAHLVRQGQPADSAFIIESGSAEAVTALPGGGELALAMLGSGSMLGEMALLDTAVRAASVVSRTPVSAFLIEREGFRMLLAQRDRAAFTVQNRVTRSLCQRLRELNARIVAADAPESAAPPLSGEVADPAGVRRGSCSFDFRAFLPILPVFRRFGAGELDAFVARTEVLELGRGQVLFRQGDPGESAYVIVRGALEIQHAEKGRRHRIGILGPGRLCGVLALIEGQAHSMSATAREATVLLEVAKPAFDALFNGHDPVAAKFQDAINRELLQSLARATIHLTRLISQARIRGGRQEQKKAEELQRALGTTECSQSR